MKKIGINIRLFLRYTAWVAGLQDFTPVAIFSNINQYRFSGYLKNKELVIFSNHNDFIRDWINKKETQRFQLPK